RAGAAAAGAARALGAQRAAGAGGGGGDAGAVGGVARRPGRALRFDAHATRRRQLGAVAVLAGAADALPVGGALAPVVDQRLHEVVAARDAAEVVGRPQHLAGRGADVRKASQQLGAVVARAPLLLRRLDGGKLIVESRLGHRLAARLVGAGHLVPHQLGGRAAAVGLGAD